MIASFGKRVTFLVATFTLALQCLAFEGDERISISFSIWSPISSNFDLVEEGVSDALRSFLCNEGDIVLLDSNYFGVCNLQDGEDTTSSWSMETFIKNTNTLFSYVLDEPTNVLISNAYEENEIIQATTWDVEYDVLRIGSIDKDRASEKNLTDVRGYLERQVQERLYYSIVDGVMNQRFVGTVIVMGIFDEEIGIPSNSISSTSEEVIVIDEAESNSETPHEETEVLPESPPVIEEVIVDDEPESNNEKPDLEMDAVSERTEPESNSEKPNQGIQPLAERTPMFQQGRDTNDDPESKYKVSYNVIGFFAEDSTPSTTERSMNDAPELDYAEDAFILRYIGIGMVGATLLSHTILSCLGMWYRRNKELKEVAALDPEYQRGLITEQGVNLMLERGRRESEMMA